MGKGNRRVKRWAALTLAASLFACRPSAETVSDGDDPIAALASPAPSAHYDGRFWTREAHRGSRIWQAARAFCDSRPTLPNCHPVELVRRWEEPPVLPPLAPPPPPPPALHPREPGSVAADVMALKGWEARLLARGKGGATRGAR